MDKTSLSSSANRKKHIFCGNHCKIPMCSPPQGWSLSRFARCFHECRRCLRFPMGQQLFIKVRKFLSLTGLEDSSDQVRLENQTNLNPVFTQTETLRQMLQILCPKTSSTLFSPVASDQVFFHLSRYKISGTNDGSRVTHNPSVMCLVVWFSLELAEILLSL